MCICSYSLQLLFDINLSIRANEGYWYYKDTCHPLGVAWTFDKSMNILPVTNLDLYSVILKVGGFEPPINEVDVKSLGVVWMGIPVPAILDCMKKEKLNISTMVLVLISNEDS